MRGMLVGYKQSLRVKGVQRRWLLACVPTVDILEPDNIVFIQIRT